jgi:hypothetical protein
MIHCLKLPLQIACLIITESQLIFAIFSGSFEDLPLLIMKTGQFYYGKEEGVIMISICNLTCQYFIGL